MIHNLYLCQLQNKKLLSRGFISDGFHLYTAEWLQELGLVHCQLIQHNFNSQERIIHYRFCDLYWNTFSSYSCVLTKL